MSFPRESFYWKGDFLDKINYFVFALLPRLGIIYLFFYLIEHTRRTNLLIFATILIGFIIFYFFPPFISVITLIKKSDYYEEGQNFILYQLLKSSQKGSGIYMINGSFLIKSYYGNAVKIGSIIMNKLNITESEYNILFKKYRRKDLIELYSFYSDRIAYTFLSDLHGFNLSDVKRLDFWNVECVDIPLTSEFWNNK
jgi:hypothetical protein